MEELRKTQKIPLQRSEKLQKHHWSLQEWAGWGAAKSAWITASEPIQGETRAEFRSEGLTRIYNDGIKGGT